jgi:REP element-mobilizing transposase RayT
MSTYTQILYQIVFGTKHHHHTLEKPGRAALFKYIAQILRNKRCHVYQVNGVGNHLHILTDLHPSVALADLLKTIKLASSKFIKEQGLFPKFSGWQVGYCAFTYSNDRKEVLIWYVQNQEAHHAKKSFREEYIELLKEHEVEFDEKYLI